MSEATFLSTLDEDTLRQMAERYRSLAFDAGAYVTNSDGSRTAIPPIMTPLCLPHTEQTTLANDARFLLSALSQAARAVMEGPHNAERELLLAPLSTFERKAVSLTYTEAEQLATARIDFLVDTQGVARALEVNATIPAMQGYADAIAAAFLRAIGEARACAPSEIESAISKNGRNSDDLLAALLHKHAQATGIPIERPRLIAILARPLDAQQGELDHYAHRWSSLGHEVMLVTPSDITRGQTGLLARGRSPDLTYRHIFLRRIDPDTELGGMLLAPTAHRIWNPPASHLELKGMLALLSLAVDDESEAARLNISIDQRAALRRRLPWTRLMSPNATSGPDGNQLPNTIEFARNHQTRLVLKRSWDYGGRGVFLGTDLDDDHSQARLRLLLSIEGEVDWNMLISHIEHSQEAWVVQELVEVEPRKMIVATEDGLESHSMYADLSAFTSLGDDLKICGGAVRASGGRIVNIQGGGGLAPLLREEALAGLLAGEKRRF